MGERKPTLESVVTAREFWAGKRVLVTGHTGFKGSWLVLWLAALGARVSGYALQAPTTPSLWGFIDGHSGIDSTLADVRDAEALASAVAAFHPEIVFHLAAQSLVRASYDDPIGTYATNVMGTVHLLDAVRRTPGIRAVVNVTSDKCYENREWVWGYRESEAMGGRDPYSNSKGCAELVTAAYRASFFDPAKGGSGIASARAGNVIGGGDWASDRIVPDMVRAALRGESVQVRNPDAIRPWQHVLEPLAGYLRLAERLWDEPAKFADGWNFGPTDGDEVTVGTIATTIAQLWGPPAGWVGSPGPHPHEAHYLKLDSAKARGRLGWKPRLALPVALEWTVDWYRKQAQGFDAKELTLAQIGRYMALEDE